MASDSQDYKCLHSGKKDSEEEEKEKEKASKAGTNAKRLSIGELSEEQFYKTFDKMERAKTVLAEMEVENGPTEWLNGIKQARKYHLASIETSKLALANLITIGAKEFSKSLFADLSKVSESLHAKHLYVALSKLIPQFLNIVRSLRVYGFEKVSNEDRAKFTSSLDVAMLKLDLSSEEDYVDL